MAWFDHPAWLPTAAFVGSAALIGAWIAVRGARSRAQRLLGRIDRPGRAAFVRDGSLLVALALIGVGLLGPQLGRLTLQPSRAGADVVLLFDLSRSMDAEDTAPSRLQRALAGGRRLLDRLQPGDRVALAGFAGRGVLFAPLTPDRDAIADMLPHLDSRMIGPFGSELAAGVEAAASAFEPTGDRPHVIVVWSDGELSDPDGALGIDSAQRNGARVVGVGIGSEAGAPVPDHGARLRDQRGEDVVSRRSLGALERLAAATDGRALAADAWGEVSVEALAALIDRETTAAAADDADGPGRNVRATRTVAVTLAWPFAAAAGLVLLAEMLGGVLAGRRPDRPRPNGTTWRRLGVVGLVAMSGLGTRAPEPLATDTSDDLAARLERGVQYALVGDRRAAKAELAAVAILSSDEQLVAIAEYDLGVIALGQEDLEQARDHFLTALVHAPDDEHVRFNAEWTLRALAARRTDEPAPTPEPQRIGGESSDAQQEDPTDANAAEHAPLLGEERLDDDRTATEATDDVQHGRAGGGRENSASEPLLDDDARARWLSRVEDDPARALSLRAREDDGTVPAPRRRMKW